jgi:predicted amidophosphoribosyltransferase
MRCPSCGVDTPEGMNFCGRCGAKLAQSCLRCGFENPPGFAFCGRCGTPLTEQPLAQQAQPLVHTPPHLAEKILTSKAALEGERKQVTVLFVALKDSTELIRGLDPEAAQQLLDPALHRMMDVVHRTFWLREVEAAFAQVEGGDGV